MVRLVVGQVVEGLCWVCDQDLRGQAVPVIVTDGKQALPLCWEHYQELRACMPNYTLVAHADHN